jgi:hypothetical protein
LTRCMRRVGGRERKEGRLAGWSRKTKIRAIR